MTVTCPYCEREQEVNYDGWQNCIISIKEFYWEYTAIQYIDKVKRVNKVCFDCWLHISNHTKRDLTWMATTANKQKCDLCWKEKYCCAIRHYL